MKLLAVSTLAICLACNSGAIAAQQGKVENLPAEEPDEGTFVEVGVFHKKTDEEYEKEIRELRSKVADLEDYKETRDAEILSIIVALKAQSSSLETAYLALKKTQLKDTARVNIAKMDLRAFQLGLQEKVDGKIDQDSLDGDYGRNTAEAVEKFQTDFEKQYRKRLIPKDLSDSEKDKLEKELRLLFNYSHRFSIYRDIYAPEFNSSNKEIGNRDGDGWLKPDEARILICDAAVGGEPLAMFFLSQMFKEGFGFVQSDDKALYTALEAVRGLDARIANRDDRNQGTILDSKRLRKVVFKWIDEDLGGNRDSKRFTDANLCDNDQFHVPKHPEFLEIKKQIKALEKVKDKTVVYSEVEEG